VKVFLVPLFQALSILREDPKAVLGRNPNTRAPGRRRHAPRFSTTKRAIPGSIARIAVR
jgi:hypothetical protein